MKFLTSIFLVLVSCTVWGQTYQGTVTDAATSEPIVGATVTLARTARGQMTDIDGRFTIEATKGETLLISFIGMETIEVVLGDERTLNFAMKSAMTDIDQAVVVGYGTQRKRDVTGSISGVGPERLEKRNLKTVGEGLQGEAAGIQITNGGRPGEQATIRIRGYGSINNNRPLILVDGQEVGTLTTVDPNDIAEINVLKDASAAAIYGNRAANGVILITTKKGKAGVQSIEYNTFFGWQGATNKVDVLNAEEYVTLLNEARDNAGLPRFFDEGETAFWQGQQGTNWVDSVLRTGFIQNHHLRYSGSDTHSTYSISGGVLQQEGIYIGTDFKRSNTRINSEHRYGKIKIGQSLAINYTEQNTGGDYYLNRAVIVAPTMPVQFADGSWAMGAAEEGQSVERNPVAMSNLIRWKNDQTHFFGNIFVDYEIIEGLNFRTRYAIDRRLTEKDYYEPLIPNPITGSTLLDGFADMADFKDLTWDWDNFLTWKRDWGKSNSTVTLGHWARHHYNSFFSAKGYGFPSNYISTIGAVSSNRQITGAWTEYAMEAYFGRVNYSLQDRYVIDATLRRDGTSRFSPETRWGTFPSVGFAWLISDEPFFPERLAVNSAKVRTSWGQLGNGSIGDYEWQTLVNFGLNYVMGEGQGLAQGAAPVVLQNENIRWETTEQLNFGADLSLLEDRLGITFDWYKKTTKDILLNVPVPATSGAVNSPRQNVGSVLNRGVELALNWSDETRNGQLSAGANIAFLHNEILDFDGVTWTTGRDGYSHIYEEGQSMRAVYGYNFIGVFQTAEEVANSAQSDIAAPGDLIFEDLSGPDGVPDGKIDQYDRTVLGSSIPKFTFGGNISWTRGSWDVNAMFQGVYGNKIMLANANFGGGRSFFDITENLVTDRLDRWTGEGSTNEMPRLYYGGSPNDNDRNSSFFMEDGSFIRLKNIQVGYSLNDETTDRWKLKDVRFYLAGTNLFTRTAFSGYDPEISAEASDSYGWEYPQAASVLIGLNVKL